jgi:hypothetical protein
MKVTDISVKDHRYIDKTNRSSNGLNPVYHINGMDYADEAYTKPKPAKKFIADSFFLQTKDINDYVVEQKSSFVRREFRNTNYIKDIVGTQSDSIKHGITTNRKTNPLTPVYQSLDPGELLLPVIPPLLPPSLIKVPTIKAATENQAPVHSSAATPSNQIFNNNNNTGNLMDSYFTAANNLYDTGLFLFIYYFFLLLFMLIFFFSFCCTVHIIYNFYCFCGSLLN